MKPIRRSDGGFYLDILQRNNTLLRIYGATENELTEKAKPFLRLREADQETVPCPK